MKSIDLEICTLLSNRCIPVHTTAYFPYKIAYDSITISFEEMKTLCANKSLFYFERKLISSQVMKTPFFQYPPQISPLKVTKQFCKLAFSINICSVIYGRYLSFLCSTAPPAGISTGYSVQVYTSLQNLAFVLLKTTSYFPFEMSKVVSFRLVSYFMLL